MNKHIVSILLVNFALVGISIIAEVTSNINLDRLQSERNIQSELIAQGEELEPGQPRTDDKSKEK